MQNITWWKAINILYETVRAKNEHLHTAKNLQPTVKLVNNVVLIKGCK